MSRLIAVRIDETLLAGVDRQRKRAHLTRAAAIKEALALWLERRRYDEAVRRDQSGYDRQPVTKDEFGTVLGAQAWPK
jgi:metal-responsive CopG/Arc/MetJ family transcriptional regulator